MSSRLSLTVLGSGGPMAMRRRVSSGYVLSIDGKPRLLVDAGGGTFERIGRSGLDISSLEQILLTHMHIDHTSDLPAVIMDLYMNDRKRPIAVTGPMGRAGNDDAPENASPQPGVSEFVRLLFGPRGAWRYMNTFEGFGITVRDTPSDIRERAIYTIPVDPVLEALDVTVYAVAVPHGMMPAVAFRVDCGAESVVFSGDISTSTASFIALAKDCSMLVHDLALPEADVPHGKLHAKPSAVGYTAQQSGAKRLLLTHVMPLMENELEPSLAVVRSEYSGPVEVAKDLETYEIGG
ncbi:MAG TPA: MBL fold metallo-hydrolase [Candidatus Acidoferrum sp.]|nr:MBL fold metallo-hydrolase [Candidatus Acidoferrum sp.]